MTCQLSTEGLAFPPGSGAMALPWKSFMEGRLQDREIRSYMDNVVVQSAYGGMRYVNENPPAATIGLTPEKITLFDSGFPIDGTPLGMSFDQATSEVVIDPGQGGAYSVIFNLNFEGEQGEVYTIRPYVDSGSGPQPGENPLFARVSQADPYAELERSAIFQVNGGWRVSVWVNADKASTAMRIFVVNLQIFRIGPQMPDLVP